MNKKINVFILAFGCLAVVQGAIHTEIVNYEHDGKKLQGFLAYDDSNTKSRPGVLVIHAWMGHDEYVRTRAKQLAELGYIAFAMDMYGKGITAKDHKEAAELSGLYRKDRKLMQERTHAGLKVLTNHKLTQKKNVAAIGYCFGGTAVLELARGGYDLAGVVSFHGGLDTPKPEKTKNVKPKILVCHGAQDPHVSEKTVREFQNEMKNSGADWQMINYGGAVHSFTIPTAGNDPSKGSAYNENADKRSWIAMQNFFTEIFKR